MQNREPSRLQTVILEIYKSVRMICELEGIRYFAIGGTAIGAVRHKGFIPWDDDLDIAMPIEDYDAFLSLAPSLLPAHLQLRTYKSCFHNQDVFAKVIDTRTTAIESFEEPFPDSYKGVWIDIMPMSGVPSGFDRKLFCSKVVLFSALNRSLRFPISTFSTPKTKIMWILSSPLRPIIRPDSIADRWMELLRSHPFGKAGSVGYTWYHWLPKLVFPSEWFSDRIEMPFENTVIPLPVGYDKYLAQQFGDYMVPPPEKDRLAHPVFLDLDHSYLEYQSGVRQLHKEKHLQD